MDYEYRVESSVVCIDLERRIKQLEEIFAIDTDSKEIFTVRDNKSGAEQNKIKTFTEITPHGSAEIKGIGSRESKKNGGRITSAFSTYSTVLIGDDGYLIHYKQPEFEVTTVQR